MLPEARTPKRKSKDEELTEMKKKKVGNSDGIKESLAEVSTTPNSPTSAPEKPGPKTREEFELPEGFTVAEKQNDEKSRKEYHGPDGKILKLFYYLN